MSDLIDALLTDEDDDEDEESDESDSQKIEEGTAASSTGGDNSNDFNPMALSSLNIEDDEEGGGDGGGSGRVPFAGLPEPTAITDYEHFIPAYPSVFADVDYTKIFGKEAAEARRRRQEEEQMQQKQMSQQKARSHAINHDDDSDSDITDNGIAWPVPSNFPNQTASSSDSDLPPAVAETLWTASTTPRSVIEQSLVTANADISIFLRLLLTLRLDALHVNYSEELVTDHLRCHRLLPRYIRLGEELPLQYHSAEHYRSYYLPLLFYDSWAQIVEAANSGHYGTMELFKRNSTNKDSSDFITIWLRGLVPGGDVYTERYSLEYYIVLLKSTTGSSSSQQLALGFVHTYTSRIQVYTDRFTAPEHLPVLGHYDDERGGSLTEVEYIIKLARNSDNMSFVEDHTHLYMQPVYYFRPNVRYVETLSLMSFKPGFAETFLHPDPRVCVLDTSQPKNFTFYEENTFNRLQKAAILGCFNAVEAPYEINKTVMIQGPPGTGKTHTLIGIVKNLFINCKQSKIRPLRLLICAPSNGAIDEIALRLIRDREFLKDFTGHKLRVVRIGQRSQVHPHVKPYLLENLVDQNFAFCQRSRQRSELRDEQLLNADIILSTLNSVQLTAMNLFRAENTNIANTTNPRRHLRAVIIDEASQSTEPEVLMPLIYPITKLILIGDHLQLPATVFSRLALRMGFGRSMFERLFRHFEGQVHKEANPMLTLCRQFRMHRSICSFPSAHFYRGRLQTPAGIGLNPRIPLQPYFIFDVTRANESQTSSLVNASKLNVEEAEFIFRLLCAIIRKLGYDVGNEEQELPEALHASIGVITFYRGQKSEITRHLEQFRGGLLLKYIDVNTVDAFQGQERDIVVLSCVRAFGGDLLHGCGEIGQSVGFVRSQQRMNVALTRAKSALYIAMHARSFTNVARWQQLLNDAMFRGRYVRCGSEVSHAALVRKISLRADRGGQDQG